MHVVKSGNIILILNLFIHGLCFSQNLLRTNLHNPNQVYVNFTKDHIVIDGDLTEPDWNEAKVANNFWLSYPVDNMRADPGIQTEVRLLNDDHNLYIGVICHGDDDYVIPTLKRDTDLPKGDGFGVVIDPVNEKTNGFVFAINPAGAQTELLITGKTGRRQKLEPGRTPEGINIAWDNKWFSAVKNFPDHWVIEIAIPFKSLRFNDKTVWDINFFRLDAGSNSIHTWSRVPIEFTELDLGYTGELVWNQQPKKVKSNISAIPYVLGSTFTDKEAMAPRENDFQAGIDGKVAITTSLNFDVTINPDFSQVEVDEQVTNLTLFDVRFPEKRLFFL
jgi:hypothetical protein